VGRSAAGRRLDRSAMELALDAVLAAVKDAGLTVADIDGLSMWPGNSSTPGMQPVELRWIKNALGLKLNWFCSEQEAPGHLSSILSAAMAVACGQARHVLCFRVTDQYASQVRTRTAAHSTRDKAKRVSGRAIWQAPFGALSAVSAHAMMTMRRMHEFGLTREQLAAVPLNSRRNAELNPRAVYRTPLTMDEYLSSRMISDPLCLYDCDAPIDGATALIISHIELARDMRKPPLRIEAISGALYGRDSWDQSDDLTTNAARDAGKRLWERTDLKPGDVQIANLYDGFSIQSLVWLEALGFCGRGESGSFVEGGARIALDGEIPLNTGGGQLSAGRLHGLGLLWESCIQLWGEGGERQVPANPRVALTATGGGPLGGCMLVTRP
jgi:acetyl-CoA acetyltransferase